MMHRIPYITGGILICRHSTIVSHTAMKGICKQKMDKEWRPIIEKKFPIIVFSMLHETLINKKLPNIAAGSITKSERP